jgi:hypothetical protein
MGLRPTTDRYRIYLHLLAVDLYSRVEGAHDPFMGFLGVGRVAILKSVPDP